MKKILKMMFVLAFLLVQIVPTTLVNADSGTNNNTGTITINNVEEGRVYTIYEILQLESYNTDANAYTYKVVNNTWKTFLKTKATAYVNVDSQDYVTWKANTDDSTKAAFAKLALEYATENKIEATKTITATTGETGTIKTTTTGVKYVEFTGLNLGYYLVDSSLGTVCGLTTTKPSATIEEKNTVPTVTKKVKEDSGDYEKSNTAQIGQEVEFQTTITIGKGAINYTLHDKMSTGLTFKEIVAIKKVDAENNKTTLNLTSDYTVKTTGFTDGCTFEIMFDNNFIKTLTTSDKLVVTYKAILNKDAVVEGNGNPNETYVKYGDNGNLETEHDTTTTYTYSFEIVKTKSDHTLLDGAEFELYTAATNGDKILLVSLGKDTNGYNVYRVATTEESTVSGFVSAKIQAGKVIIKGLDIDTYYLQETKAPNGYNQLAARAAFTVSGTNTDKLTLTETSYTSGGLAVVNYTGNELPSTGGIGTMLFVLIGSMMVLGCGVLLVTKLRMTKMSD